MLIYGIINLLRRFYMDPRAGITLRCSVCKSENYITTKNKRKHAERLEVKKYCHTCDKHTLHQEKK